MADDIKDGGYVQKQGSAAMQSPDAELSEGGYTSDPGVAPKGMGIIKRAEDCAQAGLRRREAEIEVKSPVSPYESLANSWGTYDAYFHGDHYSELLAETDTNKSRPMVNNILDLVLGNTTNLLDNQPEYAVRPSDMDDPELAEIVNEGITSWRHFSGAYFQEYMALQDASKFGQGWTHQFHEPLPPKHSRTVVLEEVVHPSQLVIAPDCTIGRFITHGPEWMIYEYTANLAKLKKLYKDEVYGEKIDWHNFDPDYTMFGTEGKRVDDPSQEATKHDNPLKSVHVYEFWLNEGPLEWTEELSAEEDQLWAKPGPEAGRRVVIAGNMVLHDGPNPYRHGQFPFTPVWAMPESDRMHPMGDIQNVMSTQTWIDLIVQRIVDMSTRSGGGIIFYVARMLKRSISNAVVQKIPLKSTSDARKAAHVERFPAAPRQLNDLVEWLSQAFDRTAGRHPVSRGEMPVGNKTAFAVEQARESDLTRIRFRQRCLVWSVERRGYQLIHNLAQFEKAGWWVQVTNRQLEGLEGDNKVLKKFDSSVFFRTVMEENKTTDRETGEEIITWKPKQKDGADVTEMLDFELTVVDTSTLPDRQQEKWALAERLLGMGAPPWLVLKWLKVPGTDEMVEAMKGGMPEPGPGGNGQGAGQPGAMADMMAMLQMQQGGGGAPPPNMAPEVVQFAELLQQQMDSGTITPEAIQMMVESLAEGAGAPPMGAVLS